MSNTPPDIVRISSLSASRSEIEGALCGRLGPAEDSSDPDGYSRAAMYHRLGWRDAEAYIKNAIQNKTGQQQLDPDGEIVRAGFREFDGPGRAAQHTHWQVWRAAVEWCMSRGVAPVANDSVTVRYDLSTAATDESIRSKLMEMGWMPPQIKDSIPQEAADANWKLVPCEPTPEMYAAVLDEGSYHEDTEKVRAVLRGEYQSMLAAAPQPPTQEQPEHRPLTDEQVADFVGATGHMRQYAAGVWKSCIRYHVGGFQPNPDRKLTEKARVGGAVFGVGVHESTVIRAAIRHYKYHAEQPVLTPEQRRDDERKRREFWDMIHGPLEQTELDLRTTILAAADRHRIAHTLRPLESVLGEVLEAERRAGWAEGAPTECNLLPDELLGEIMPSCVEMEHGTRWLHWQNAMRFARCVQEACAEAWGVKLAAPAVIEDSSITEESPDHEFSVETLHKRVEAIVESRTTEDSSVDQKGAPVGAGHGDWTMFASKAQADTSREGGAA